MLWFYQYVVRLAHKRRNLYKTHSSKLAIDHQEIMIILCYSLLVHTTIPRFMNCLH